MDASYLSCPQCKNTFDGKIFLCESGHGICEFCSALIKACPKCAKTMTDKRSNDLEGIIQAVKDKVRISCEFTNCTYKIISKEYDAHKLECKYRKHDCQVWKYSEVNCNWAGSYDQLLDHFHKHHPKNAFLTTNVKYFNLVFTFKDFKDIQLLNYLDGKQLFYYKCEVDEKKEKVYFIFQFIGPKREARNYTYEFEINKGHRKFKVTGHCLSDVEDCFDIIENEDCISLSFQHLRHYLNEKNEVEARYRIGNINYVPKESTNQLPSPENHARTSHSQDSKVSALKNKQNKKRNPK